MEHQFAEREEMKVNKEERDRLISMLIDICPCNTCDDPCQNHEDVCESLIAWRSEIWSFQPETKILNKDTVDTLEEACASRISII